MIGTRISLWQSILGGTTGAALGGDGPTYDADSLLIFAAMTTPPSTTRKALIDAMVVALKTAGVWSLLDVLYVLAAADSQAGRINWKAPGTSTLTASNSPTFTVDRGYAGDGVSASLLTGRLFTGGQYVQDNNLLFAWETADINSATMWAWGGAGSSGINRMLGRSGTTAIGRNCSATSLSPTLPVSTSIGLTAFQRTGASAAEAFKNGVSMGTGSPASSAPSAVNAALLRDNTIFSTRGIALAGFGASLTAGQHTSLYNVALAYLQAVGAT